MGGSLGLPTSRKAWLSALPPGWCLPKEETWGFLDHISDIDMFLTAVMVEMLLVLPHIEGAALVATVNQDNQLLETETL